MMARDDSADAGRFDRFWPLLFVIFLPNLGPPLTALFHSHPAPFRLGAALIATMLFVTIYLWAAWQSELSRAAPSSSASEWSHTRRWGQVVILTVLGVILILGYGSSWLALLIFTSATAGCLPLSQALRTVASLVVLVVIMSWLTHDTISDLSVAAFWTGMTGALTIIVTHLRRTNRALRAAREEIAHLAVETERLRFARDLHDLLGHDLARIALQSELAEALVPTAPEKAIGVMREVGGAARTALQEVRAAVAGYRQPTLHGELRGAAEILAAAGIRCTCEGDRVAVPPTVEATLAWVVREGVTNVVKHSRAQHCLIRLAHGGSTVAVEVIDDGCGTGSRASDPDHGGSGLPGLCERAVALGGCCDAGPYPGGGFRLRVTLPVAQEARVADLGEIPLDRRETVMGERR